MGNRLFKIFLFFLPILIVSGNFIMQFTLLGIPVNELLIILLFCFNINHVISSNNYKNIKHSIVLWFTISVILIFTGLFTYGIVAGRDGTGQIDILLLLVLISLPYKLISFAKFEKIILTILIFKLIDRFILGSLFGFTFGEFGLPIFGGTIGINIAITSAFILGLIKFDINYKYKLLFFGALLLIVSTQNRYMYIGITMIVFYLLYLRLIKFKKLLVYSIILSVFLSFLSNLGSVGSGLIGFKYGGIPSPTSVVEHLMTSFGVESDNYSGSSDGFLIRSLWWADIINKSVDDSSIAFFGQGFGIPLTNHNDYKIIREPHNSYLSVFARGGIFYFLIWLSILSQILKKLHKSVRNIHSTQHQIITSLVAISILISTLIMAIVQPAFELPPVATGTYFFIGIALNYMKYENSYR